MWIATRVMPIATPAKPTRWVGARAGHAEDADQEQEGPDHLENEGRKRVILAKIAFAPAVLAQTAVPALRLAGEDDIKNHRADDRAQDLGYP